ncbi:hypothetical protein [Streptomyces jeddahensis]|uniref:Uncharacterized protein n=1 Tax=Streptomyces jeddahensis TaxID=1716141 RepID=A0A177HJE1_9ACTN|nr:hypothetical protein [Streptomyces jeddahensis]OAH10856.1 hypothetical protein STSP_56980 [Streptomyces jeddahensis]
MTTEGPGKSAAWAKALAAFVLLVLMPLVIWFMVAFQRSLT